MKRHSPRTLAPPRVSPSLIVRDDIWISLLLGLLLLGLAILFADPAADPRVPDPLPPAARLLSAHHG